MLDLESEVYYRSRAKFCYWNILFSHSKSHSKSSYTNVDIIANFVKLQKTSKIPIAVDANPKEGRQPVVWPKFSENCMKMKKSGPRRGMFKMLSPVKTVY